MTNDAPTVRSRRHPLALPHHVPAPRAVIFCDIDETLTSRRSMNAEYFARRGQRQGRAPLRSAVTEGGSLRRLDSGSVRVLRQLVRRSGATVVIASVWNAHPDAGALLARQLKLPAGRGPVRGPDVRMSAADRASTVLAAAQATGLPWVSFDDIPLRRFQPDRRFIHTPRGLRGVHLSAALKHLGVPT